MRMKLVHSLCLLLIAGATSACSISTIAVRNIFDPESANQDNTDPTALELEEDPALVEAMLPTLMVSLEAVHRSYPDNPALAQTVAQLFLLYGTAFVEEKADRLELADVEAARIERQRAHRFYTRARDFMLRSFAERYPEAVTQIRTQPDRFAAALDEDESVYLYWLGAAWSLVIASANGNPDILAELAVPEAIMRHIERQNPALMDGALDEFFFRWEIAQAGSAEAQAHALAYYERAFTRSHGRKLGLLVAWAEKYAVAVQDREGFERVLRQVLAFDMGSAPEYRLFNTIAQRRAAWLLARIDDLFL